MPIRYYIIPYIEHRPSRWRIKYLTPTIALDVDGRFVSGIFADIVYSGGSEGYTSLIYGLNGVALVRTDVTNAQHLILKSKSDVISFPEDLDDNLTDVAIVNTTPKLESFNIPVDWLSTSLTYRQALRRIARIFKVFLKLHQKFQNKIFDPGFSLSSQFKDFSDETKSNLIDVATEYNIDLTQYSNTTTVREIIKSLMNAQSGATGLGDL